MAKRWTTIKRLQNEGWTHEVVADDVNTGDQVWRHDYVTREDLDLEEAMLVVVSVHEEGSCSLNVWTWLEAACRAKIEERSLSVLLVQRRFQIEITSAELVEVLRHKTIYRHGTPSAYYKLTASIS